MLEEGMNAIKIMKSSLSKPSSDAPLGLSSDIDGKRTC
jgi:hypothetical protein